MQNEPMSIRDRLRHGWNAFKNKDPTNHQEGFNDWDKGYVSGNRPDRNRLHMGNEKSIIAAIYNRIALDVSAVSMLHVRTSQNGSYLETINSPLNNALNVEANTDQSGRAFMQDVVMSLFDEGTVAVVPVETSVNPFLTDSYNIHTLRTGRVVCWFPEHVRVELYNEKSGVREEVTLPKKMVAIIENPLYAVMNERNSVLQKLIRKLNLLDTVEEQASSGKLDLIMQLPYVVRSDLRKKQAQERRDAVEKQLVNSKYGIAYVDATERITQLNRPVENNLLASVQYLTNMLYSQLGLTEGVFNGTAEEGEMINYWKRTVEPVLSAIRDEYRRKFLTKTARTQNQSIMFFRGAFMLVPAEQLADLADKFTRNEILSPNEVRAEIGYRPSEDPRSDELRNRNLNAEHDQLPIDAPKDGTQPEKGEASK